MAGGYAREVYDWSGGAPLTYWQFLQAREFETSVRFAIEDQTRQLIGSNEQLMRQGFSAVETALSDGFAQISQDLGSVENAIRETGEAIVNELHWGFSELLLSVGRVNDSLQELIQLTRSPSQVWAYEQFDIARDEYRRGLVPEALKSVDRAISGHGSNPGMTSDFRFHYLRGLILLGSYRNTDPKTIDLVGAEAAFVQAARYARVDEPIEAGRALLGAARAAMVRNEIDTTLDHAIAAGEAFSKAPGVRPIIGDYSAHHAPALYMIGRCYALQNDPEAAKNAMAIACTLNPRLSVTAAGEAEFRPPAMAAALREAIEFARGNHAGWFNERLSAVTAGLDQARSATLQSVPVVDEIGAELRSLQDQAADLARRRAGGPLLGYVEGIDEAGALADRFGSLYRTFAERAAARLRSLDGKTQEAAKKAEARLDGAFLPLLVVSSIGFVGLAVLVTQNWAPVLLILVAPIPIGMVIWRGIQRKRADLKSETDQKSRRLRDDTALLTVGRGWPFALQPASTKTVSSQDGYNVVLIASGEAKINVIKVLRDMRTELSLTEAKVLVENPPQTLAENLPLEQAKAFAQPLRQAGAAVEIRSGSGAVAG